MCWIFDRGALPPADPGTGNATRAASVIRETSRRRAMETSLARRCRLRWPDPRISPPSRPPSNPHINGYWVAGGRPGGVTPGGGRSHQAAGGGPPGQLVAVRQLELAEDRGHVRLHRLHRDVELARDLLVRVAAS